MKNNSLDFEISFYEKIVREKPDYVDALVLLAQAYTSRKQYGKGLEVDLRLVKLRPLDPIVQYNLACSYALLGLAREALNALEEAIKIGYDDFGHMKKDKDLISLHQNKKFQTLITKGGQSAD